MSLNYKGNERASFPCTKNLLCM